MVVGGSKQETLDPSCVLFDTRHQCVPVILRELMLPCHPGFVSQSQSKLLCTKLILSFIDTHLTHVQGDGIQQESNEISE
ncbi:unnamed protein product [Schistosoma margrebowiei]|uniref:Uncharacterized protein n=1 Tax=Schistosoma margrebowiei TaxID=48269 RepID=A0A183MS20_9TREM|nr:unnamed protein product [Schistosoma margrebowiei]